MTDTAVFDFKTQSEFSGLSSVRGETYDPEANNVKITQDGIIRQIKKELQWSPGGLNDHAFQEWGRAIFDDTFGSDQKVLFTTGEFLSALGSIPTVKKQMEAKESELVLGVRTKRIETNFGEFLIVRHKALDYVGLEGGALSLDMEYVDKYIFEPMGFKNINLEESGQSRENVTRLLENSCYALKNIGAHSIIRKA